ncbi:hypothetical protein [Bacillus cereus group sp. BfR-BA-01518]|uniref:hypothetical protein n=1 Tax=Bacillus cereus group sp. BfR-BA-01518 TaxID=2920368 RepID=UPI001F56DF13|nr:hypothetical protein [Bacillus cereus group sp. BfR-BA-01518]
MPMTLIKKVTKDEILQSIKNEKELKLRSRRSEKDVMDILKIESALEELSFEELYTAISPFIKNFATQLAYKWNSKRISQHDFESVFMEELWKLYDKYDPSKSEYYFSEVLSMQLNRRKWDVTRHFTQTNQSIFENNTQSLDVLQNVGKDIPSPTNMENEVVNTIVAEQILNDDELLFKQEKQLLQAKYERPSISYRELANELNLNHYEQARRIYKRATNKITNKYIFLD